MLGPQRLLKPVETGFGPQKSPPAAVKALKTRLAGTPSDPGYWVLSFQVNQNIVYFAVVFQVRCAGVSVAFPRDW